jgi:hypothetical protein
MLRTCFHQLRQYLRGGKARSRAARRNPAPVRLSVEALERREVLSGNTAGYHLAADFTLTLYNINDRRWYGGHPVDGGVVDFTAPGGVVYDLHSDGTIHLFNGSFFSTIGTNGRSLVSDATGNVFALFTDGTIAEYNRWALSPWTTVGSNASSLVVDATGTVFGLDTSGRVGEHVPGTGWGWVQVGSSNRNLVSDAAGNVFGLTYDGTLYRQGLGSPGAWYTVGSGYSRLVSDAFHNYFLLTADGNMYQHTSGGLSQVYGSFDSQGYTALVGGAGNVIALDTHGLMTEHNAGAGQNWTSVGWGSFSRLVSDAAGNIFGLSSASGYHGMVYQFTGPYNNLQSSYTGAYNISSLVSDATGNVFALSYDNSQVYEHVLSTTTGWSYAGASDISSLVSDAAGNIFVLSFGNNAVYEHVVGSGSSWTQVGSNTRNLVSDATGNVFGLTYDGTVYEQELGSPGAWDTVGSDASSLYTDVSGNVFAWFSGVLWVHNLWAGCSWTPVSSGQI